MLSLWVIRRSLHLDKIYKKWQVIPYNSNVFIKILFSVDIAAYFSNQRTENSSEIAAHGTLRSVKQFLQPIKLREISILMRSWNYTNTKDGTKYNTAQAEGQEYGSFPEDGHQATSTKAKKMSKTSKNKTDKQI